jgi:hypothetical protein
VAEIEWHPGDCTHASALLSPTWHGRPTASSPCTTSAAPASSTSRKIKWTRLSCRTFASNAVRLQLHALAYNLGNFMRAVAMPGTAQL